MNKPTLIFQDPVFQRDYVTLSSISKKNIRLNIGCDGTGFSFIISKEKMRELIR